MSRLGPPAALDIGPLSWVIDEVRASLGNCVAALKNYAAGDHDATQLKFAKTHLHQAHGALQIVDMPGIAAITEQAERLLERFDAAPDECGPETLARVEHAFGGLLDYLDDLLAGNTHQPIRLYPHYRDLLKAVHAERVHPADLLFVDTGVRVPDDAPAEAADAERLGAARARFERGLLRLLRNVEREQGIADMRAAVQDVRAAQPRGAGRSFWIVMEALCESLDAAAVPASDLNLKRLCARTNLQMRRTIEGSGSFAERLLKDALFYVALANAPAPTAQRVRAAFALEGAVPVDFETTRYGRVDTQLIKRAKDQLVGLKSSWDRLMAGQTGEAAGFEAQIRTFAEACAALREPALDELATVLAEIGAHVARARALPSEAVGMETATAMLFVENTLETFNRLEAQFPERARLIASRLRRALAGQPIGESVEWLAEISRRSHDRSTMVTLVAEIQANLRAIEQTLDAFFRDHNKRDALGATLPLIDQTAGALLLLGHQTASDALEFGRTAIQRFKQPDYVADQREFERVAQSFGALGFFIDALRQPDNAARPALEFDAQEGAYVARMTVEPAVKPAPVEAGRAPEIHATDARAAVSSTWPEIVAPTIEAKAIPDTAREAASPLVSELDLPLAIPPIDFEAAGDDLIEQVDVTSVERETQERAQHAMAMFDQLRTQPMDLQLRTLLRDEIVEMRQGAELLDDAKLVGAARNALSLLSNPLDAAGIAELGSALGEFSTATPVKEAPAPDASTLALAAADDAVIDAELLSIFLAEAREVFETIDEARTKAIANPSNQEHLTTLRRAFHTLKGSSRMVGLRVFGEGAWAVEQVFNLWLAEEKSGTPALFALAGGARDQMAAWIDRIEAGEQRAVRPEPLIAAAERVKAGEDFFLDAEAGEEGAPVSAPEPAPAAEPVLDLASMVPDEVIEVHDVAVPDEASVLHVPGAEELPTGAVVPEEAAAPPSAADDVKRIGDLTISAQLYAIYLAEADDRLRALADELAAWRHEPGRVVSERAIRSAHTLSGTSATAGVGPVHDLAGFLEQVLIAVERAPVEVQTAEFDKLDDVVERLRAMLHQFAAGFYPAADPGALATIDELRVAWQSRQQTPLHLAAVAAAAAEAVAPGAPVAPPAPVVAETPAPVPAAILAAESPVAESPVVESASVAAVAGEDEAPVVNDEIDPELLEIFAAEAHDYLPRIEADLRSLMADPAQPARLANLLRGLHTVKGSSRMAGAMRLGARLHDMETRAERAREQPSATLYEELLAKFDDAVAQFETLLTGTVAPAARAVVPTTERIAPAGEPVLSETVSAPATETKAEETTGGPLQAAAAPAVAAAPAALPALQTGAMEPAVSAFGDGAVSIVPAGPQGAVATRQRGTPGALVRIKSEVLDRLVNQAGEVAIARSRLENDLGGVRGALGELTENVGRLRGQLREIEIAAEAQMESRLEAQRHHAEEFDPLEFDRYTRLQELTRMMAESVNDVAMVQQNIVRSLEGAGKDLTNQARLTRDLQQDLMRVRMVPVDSAADRLYRVVRQAAKETGKRVALNIVGGNVELDRGVLERMTGAFEHVLRNAVVHGIEVREARLAAGKAESGTVNMSVRYEGNEALIEFIDDGAGLDLARIRARAVEHGLLTASDAASDAEAAALIFNPGFSTATEVTELAGRGVGMDVVRAEAGALGGRVEVETAPGRGTRFAIRLPLTLAVTQVVLVRAGGRIHALPSVLVEQVQQLRPAPLASAYNDGHLAVFGERVDFAYLPFLLGDHTSVPVAQRYSPVIAVRSGGRRVALHVDEVIGNQEVVVKNVGPQLARMVGVVGATVLGSGEIVLILDPVQLVGRVRLLPAAPVTPLSATGAVGEIIEGARPPRTDIGGVAHAPVVMVVDDSVTVRRVTQRLLVREGYQVVLAKDGVDALEQMQDFPPDIMLVDIEMPRMDGFDLTRNVRTDPRFKKVPIVMITSRTADKHRNMAFSLGVDVYLGKPYQELELLETIKRFVGERTATAG